VINQYLRAGHKKNPKFPIIYGHLQCVDGFHMSVQASSGHYCIPRSDKGPWTEVEIGFPSRPVALLADFKDGDDDDTKSVFAYVPIELVEELVNLHGGICAPIKGAR